MKKIYVLGLAMACGLSVMAAPKSVNKIETMSQADLQAISYPVVETVSGPARAVTSVNDLIGLKEWTSVGHLNSSDKNGPMTSYIMVEAGEDATSVNLVGFPWGGKSTKALVNIPAKTLTITNRTYCGENGGDPVYIYTYTASESADGEWTTTKQNRVTATIEDDGTIVFPENVWIGASDDANEAQGSYYYLQSDNKFTAKNYTTVDLADYEIMGECVYNDGFFNPLLIGQNIPAIENVTCNMYRNKTNPDVYVIQNPYADPQWKEIGLAYSGSNQEGYIMLNIGNPDCVCIVPLLECGMVTDDSDTDAGEPAGSVLTKYYPWNTEGKTQFTGGDLDALLEEWMLVGEEGSNIVDSTCTLYHLYFGISGAPIDGYWWTADNNERIATVEFPDGFGGIEGVASDMVDGPVKYYNLQGVEVAAPVKGEVTIKTQGNKTTKFIAR